MKFKPNYIIIPLITIATALVGSSFTQSGMVWYDERLIRPDWNPADWVFAPVWTIIFVLTTIAALLVWNSAADKSKKRTR